MENQIIDTVAKVHSSPIAVKLIEDSTKIDWNIWFLLIAVLSLIAAVLIPFVQRKYEERRTKYGFHLYVKKRIGIVWNLLTYDKYEYKQPRDSESMDDLVLTFDKIILQFETDYNKNKNTIHPLFAFGLLFNLQNLLLTVKRIQLGLSQIDLTDLDEKTLAYGDKLSKKEHNKLSGIFMLVGNYFSITDFHDKFDSLSTIKRDIKNSKWIGLKVDSSVLKNQDRILSDLAFLRENELSINEILNVNKLLIQEIKSYFNFTKLVKKKRK